MAKKNFEQYEETKWLTDPSSKATFDNDKQKAQAWLQENNQFTIKDLYKQIETLKESLRKS